MYSPTQKKISLSIISFAIVLTILLIFVKQDLDERDTYLCQMFHENPGLDMLQCPAHTTNTSWYIVAAFGFAFLVLGAGIYLLIGSVDKVSSKVEQKTEEKIYAPIDLSQLDDEEKNTFNHIKEHDGSMYQSDLMKQLNVSKVHMTRILDKMEGKKILERKRRGMTNIVILK